MVHKKIQRFLCVSLLAICLFGAGCPASLALLSDSAAESLDEKPGPGAENKNQKVAPSESAFYLSYTSEDGVVYRSFSSDGVCYLYLPYGVPNDSLILWSSHDLSDASGFKILGENAIEAGVGTFTVTDRSAQTFNISVSVSDVPSVSVLLNGVDLSAVHDDKSIKYDGQTVIITGDGYAPVTDEAMQFKCRGNYSLTLKKKPYQIKLSRKENVLGMGASRTWVLLANHGDASLIRNALALEVAEKVGMPFTPQWRCVDLWIDGKYLGNYTLCEKVQVGKNRVDLQDENGLIAEMDNNYFAEEDLCFVAARSGMHFVLKDSVANDAGEPESVSEDTFSSFAAYIDIFETELYAQSPDWTAISSMIDVDSFIRYYFIQEFTENPDGMRSSVYLYKDGYGDVLHMGPVWDFDLALGNCFAEAYGGLPDTDYILNAKKYAPGYSCDWYEQLFSIPEFCEAALVYYNDYFRPVLEETQEMISAINEAAECSFAMNFNRWHILGGENLFGSHRGHNYESTHAGEVEFLRTWVAARAAYMNERYQLIDCDASAIVDAFYTGNN